MQITIFGANGKVGKLVVAEALQQGHSVVATMHHRTSVLSSDPKLRIAQCDIYNPDEVVAAVAGSEAIISTLSSWGTPKKDVLSVGMEHIINAMNEHGIHRIISLTGADARAAGDTLSLVHKLSHSLINITSGKILIDGEQHIKLLKESGLDWTAIRSGIMNEHGDSNKFTLSAARPMPWATINRHSVALCMIKLLNDTTYHQQAPFIIRR